MNPNLLWLIPLLPFTGFLLNGTLGRRLPRPAVTGIALLFTAIPTVIVAYLWTTFRAANAPEVLRAVSAPWIKITGFEVPFAFTVDHLTLIMLSVVTGVGFLIHLYSAGYMAHEDGYWRFFAYLNLFMFFMSVLVLAESFLLLFVGWEGVGLASYLLIGFYFKKDAAADAGKKAFIVNRIGDFGFLLAMFLLIAHFGTLNFTQVFSAIAARPDRHGGFLTAICLMLVLGAAGKSAQIPLYVWLPDAMEGPTPVSALIHAATMVTAGIYMVARCHVLFDRSPYALGLVALIGAATAIFAAAIGLVQTDIKRVLAYSTVSQLGYMFLACGVAAYSAAIFHLMTHAFFKALLFLAAGSVIHALSGEQDMRKMGGLWKRIPVTFGTMLMGVIAISGIPPWAGFFSKDEILHNVFISSNPLAKLLWLVGLVTAGMTSFYMFRLLFKTFFGVSNVSEAEHDAHQGHTTHQGEDEHDEGQASHPHGVHESSWIMLLPLVVLAILSTFGGLVGIPGHSSFEHFLDPVFGIAGADVTTTNSGHGTEIWLAIVSVSVALLGFAVAWFLYIRKAGSSTALAQRFRPVHSLLIHKFYVDELYHAFLVTPLFVGTRIFLYGLIDFVAVDGSGKLAGASTRGLSSLTRRIQSGNIRSYAGWLALGAAAVLAVMIFGRGPWTH